MTVHIHARESLSVTRVSEMEITAGTHVSGFPRLATAPHFPVGTEFQTCSNHPVLEAPADSDSYL